MVKPLLGLHNSSNGGNSNSKSSSNNNNNNNSNSNSNRESRNGSRIPYLRSLGRAVSSDLAAVAAAFGATFGASSFESLCKGLDAPGRRFVFSARLFALRCEAATAGGAAAAAATQTTTAGTPWADTARGPGLCMPAAHVANAVHSACGDSLLRLCFPPELDVDSRAPGAAVGAAGGTDLLASGQTRVFSSPGLYWGRVRAVGAVLWLRSPAAVRALAERLARAQFLRHQKRTAMERARRIAVCSPTPSSNSSVSGGHDGGGVDDEGGERARATLGSAIALECCGGEYGPLLLYIALGKVQVALGFLKAQARAPGA